MFVWVLSIISKRQISNWICTLLICFLVCFRKVNRSDRIRSDRIGSLDGNPGKRPWSYKPAGCQCCNSIALYSGCKILRWEAACIRPTPPVYPLTSPDPIRSDPIQSTNFSKKIYKQAFKYISIFGVWKL